jgi:regulator of RNase E activity RraA
VIDGVCRDSERTVQLEYSIFTRGRTMRTGKSRLELAGTQVPVAIGAVRVEPGDLVLGDADGVVVVPASRHREVARVAREIAAAEDRIRRAIAAGESLAEARLRTGYHKLQEGR